MIVPALRPNHQFSRLYIRISLFSEGWMLKRPQSGVSFQAKCVLHILMVTVFFWGLHIKLSHYSPSMSSSNSVSVSAKLLTDKCVEHSADSYAVDVKNDPGQRIEVPAFSAIHAVP